MDESELLPGEEPVVEGWSPPTIHGRTPAEWVEPRVDTAETRWLYFASAGHRGATTPT
jgi:hypothetical protein